MGYLPKDVHIVGYARTKMDSAEYHKRASSHLKVLPAFRAKQDEFMERCTYVSGQYDKDEDFQNLTRHMDEIESK